MRDEQHRHARARHARRRPDRACRRAGPGRAKRKARRAAAPGGRAPARGPARRAGARRRRVRAAGVSPCRQGRCAQAPRRSPARSASVSLSDGERPSPTFCSTVRWANRLFSWNTIDTGRAAGGAAPTSAPPISTRPDCGVSKPATRLSSVDLPEPLGPMMAVIRRGEFDIEEQRRLAIAERDLVQPHGRAFFRRLGRHHGLLPRPSQSAASTSARQTSAEQQRQAGGVRRCGSCPCAPAGDRAASAPNRCRTAR